MSSLFHAAAPPHLFANQIQLYYQTPTFTFTYLTAEGMSAAPISDQINVVMAEYVRP